MRARRHLRLEFSAAEKRRGGTRAGRQIPFGPRQALLAREQLDLPAAAASDHGALRPVPDLLGRLPHLRGQRPQRAVPADVSLRDHAPPVLQVRAARRPALRLAARRNRAELAAGRAAGRAGLPLQPVPALRPDLPDRRRQRPGRPRTAQALQPGDGHRAQGASRQRLDAAVEGRLLHRHERRGGQGQHRVHRRGHQREDRHRGRRRPGTWKAPTSC